MPDPKPFQHGEEGTHSVCNKHSIGGKSVCCECSGKAGCGDDPKTDITELPEWAVYEAKEIVGAWGYEESYWWKPIAKALAIAVSEERGVKEKYQELIMAVETKYEGESRHETALKYIRSAEKNDYGVAGNYTLEKPVTKKD